MKSNVCAFVSALAISVAVSAIGLQADTQAERKTKKQPAGMQALLTQPLLFEKNNGQTDGRVKYLARSAGGVTYFFEENNLTMMLAKSFSHSKKIAPATEMQSHALKVTFIGANVHPAITAEEPASAISNYFIGNQPDAWQTHVANYQKIRYHNIYDGIDLIYYGNGKRLEYDFVVHPNADPSVIRIQYDGAEEALRLAEDGSVAIATSVGLMNEMKPVVYQTGRMKKEIAARWQVVGDNELQFALGEYDRSQTLYIDPILHSTFVGGSGNDESYNMAVDQYGYILIVGQTTSSNYPTKAGAYDVSFNGAGGNNNWGDVFVTQLAPAGALVYSTFLGGSKGEAGLGIFIDANRHAIITGSTSSSDYPTTASAFDRTFNGGSSDVFVTRLNANGSGLWFSTYLGGSSAETGTAIARDTGGNNYLVGYTNSNDFPTTTGAYDQTYNGASVADDDVFVAKLNAGGTALVYSTFIGGSGTEHGMDMALGANGFVYVTGMTTASDFPTTPGAYDVSFNGGAQDGYVTKLNAAGSALLYSTFLGGSEAECDDASIAIDANANAYIVGNTTSADFPTTSGAFDVSYNGAGGKNWGDVFVTKINAAGSGLIYGTFVGGSGDDEALNMALDRLGNVHFTGMTTSTNYPIILGAVDSTFNGGTDVMVTKLNANGALLSYSTFVGGSGDDRAEGIAVDFNGYTYIAGFTASTNYPTTAGALDASFNGGSNDAFVTMLDITPPKILPAVTSPQAVGKEFWVYISLGTSATPVVDLMGVSFTLDSYIDVAAPYSSNVLPGAVMGASSNLVFYYSVDSAYSGRLNIAVTRKSGQGGVSGFGTVARVKFVSRSSMPHATQIKFSIWNVVAIDKSGAPLQLASGEKTITLNNTGTTPIVVWPGDTNNDNMVNQADILPIGLYWGSTGPARPNASLNWASQPLNAWAVVAAATYADANGNGKIDQADVLPIGFNWGKSHAGPALFAEGEMKKSKAIQSATITPVVKSSVPAPEQEFSMLIQVDGANSLFGLAFELVNDQPQLLQTLSVEPDSLFGPEIIFYSNIDAVRGKIAVGISRKVPQSGINGSGAIVRVKAKIAANASAGAKINLTLQNLVANDAKGSKLYLNTKAATIIIGSATRVDEKENTSRPASYRLLQNHPNPFRATTAIRYELPEAGQVVLQVYNLAGQEVLQLVNSVQQPGRYSINWDGHDQRNRLVPSGVYVCRLQAGSPSAGSGQAFVQTQRIIVVR